MQQRAAAIDEGVVATTHQATPRRPAGPNAGAPAVLRPLLDGIDFLSRIDGWMAGICLSLLASLLLADVALRALSRLHPAIPANIPVTWEYCSYLMAATFTFGAAMTLRSGGHIRVLLVLEILAPTARRVAEIVTALAGLILTGFLALAMIRFTWSAFEGGQTSTSSDTPLWIPEAVVTFGIILFALQFLARFLQAVLGLPLEDKRLKIAALAE
jgi:TRAP-type C4-dicarboxylate transport system permease small subunit